MGRPKTPTALLDARGAFKKHPERKRNGEPQVRESIGLVPDWFSPEQVSAWQQITSSAPMGVLTGADSLAVEISAVLLAEFRYDPAEFQAGKLGRLQSFLGQFGMTPADRAKLSIEKAPDVNPFDSLS